MKNGRGIDKKDKEKKTKNGRGIEKKTKNERGIDKKNKEKKTKNGREENEKRRRERIEKKGRKKEKEEQEKKEKERREQEEKAKLASNPPSSQPTKTTSRPPSSQLPQSTKVSNPPSQPTKATSQPVSKVTQSPPSQPPAKTTAPVTKQTILQSYLNSPKNVPLDATDKYLEEKKKMEAEERGAVFGARNKVVEKPEFQQFGIDYDIQQKIVGKYDTNLEKEAMEWIESVTGLKLEGSLVNALKSGVVLCTLINKIKPNTIKHINNAKMAFMQMENIKFFLDAAKGLGVPEPDLFMTVDLFEEKNLTQVVQTIHSLGRVSQKIKEYNGPTIGAKLASKRETYFTEEQLKRGQVELNYAQKNQTETQKVVSEMKKTGLDSVVKSHSSGITTAEVGLLDKGKSDAQKEANAARRVGHNIIK